MLQKMTVGNLVVVRSKGRVVCCYSDLQKVSMTVVGIGSVSVGRVEYYHPMARMNPTRSWILLVQVSTSLIASAFQAQTCSL